MLNGRPKELHGSQRGVWASSLSSLLAACWIEIDFVFAIENSSIASMRLWSNTRNDVRWRHLIQRPDRWRQKSLRWTSMTMTILIDVGESIPNMHQDCSTINPIRSYMNTDIDPTFHDTRRLENVDMPLHTRLHLHMREPHPCAIVPHHHDTHPLLHVGMLHNIDWHHDTLVWFLRTVVAPTRVVLLLLGVAWASVVFGCASCCLEPLANHVPALDKQKPIKSDRSYETNPAQFDASIRAGSTRPKAEGFLDSSDRYDDCLTCGF